MCFALLSSEQPKCPLLYIYSSADRVILAKSVESFIEKQRRAGHEVRACDFLSSPHVDHFRNHPGLYTSQLTNFLEDCVLTCCKDSQNMFLECMQIIFSLVSIFPLAVILPGINILFKHVRQCKEYIHTQRKRKEREHTNLSFCLLSTLLLFDIPQ